MFSRRTSLAAAGLVGLGLARGARARAKDTGPLLPTRGRLARLSASALQAVLRAQRGKVVVLHLWATWCAPCVRELPRMARLAARLRADDAVVLSLSLDPPGPRTAARVERLLDTRGPGLTRAIADLGEDPESFIAVIDPRWPGHIPTLFGYDRGGQLGGALFGETTEASIESLIEELRGRLAAPTPSSSSP